MLPVGESGVEKQNSRNFCVDKRGHGEGTGWEARWRAAGTGWEWQRGESKWVMTVSEEYGGVNKWVLIMNEVQGEGSEQMINVTEEQG
jgi:hypothetical protein